MISLSSRNDLLAVIKTLQRLPRNIWNSILLEVHNTAHTLNMPNIGAVLKNFLRFPQVLNQLKERTILIQRAQFQQVINHHLKTLTTLIEN